MSDINPDTTFHEISVKVSQPLNPLVTLKEEITIGKFKGTDISIQRNIGCKLLMIDVSNRHYIVDVVDIVQGIIDYEKAKTLNKDKVKEKR